MMGNLYKNQDSKFSLWAKRLVWNGLDANVSIDVAITGAQNSNEVKTPAEILAVAEADLLEKKPTDYEEKVESKEAYDKALLAVRAAKERFEQVAKDLATKVALTARLAAVDPAADLLHADEEMKDIKAKNDLLPQEMRIEVSGIEALINNEADSYYNEKQAVEWFNGEIVTVEEGDETNDKCRAIMADVAEMQQAKLNGFPGLADEKKAVMNTAYILRINEGLAWLNANKATMTADEQKGLRDFDRAKSNWDAAELSKEAQHKAGAEQYFGMILAEQEARRVWQKLPDTRDPATSWRSTTNILSPLTDLEIQKGWADNPGLANLYQEAVALFNKARQMAVVSQENRANAGRVYMDATLAYKQAADKFRGVLASYNEVTKKNGEETAEETNSELRNARTAMEQANIAFHASEVIGHKTKIPVVEGLVQNIPVEDVETDVAIFNMKERTRIYSQSLAAMRAEKAAWVEIDEYREWNVPKAKDFTANAIWQNAEKAFNSGDFEAAAGAFREVELLYAHMNEKPDDRSKSMALDVDRKLRVFTKQESEEAKNQVLVSLPLVTYDVQSVPFLDSLFGDAEKAHSEGFYAHAVVQYREIQRLSRLAAQANKTKESLPAASLPSGMTRLQAIGDQYYKQGNFEAANNYYSQVAKLAYPSGPEIPVIAEAESVSTSGGGGVVSYSSPDSLQSSLPDSKA